MDNNKQLYLRQWRLRADLTQTQLANLSGVTPRTIAAWESDINEFRRAKYSNVERVASALGIHIDNFILH